MSLCMRLGEQMADLTVLLMRAILALSCSVHRVGLC